MHRKRTLLDWLLSFSSGKNRCWWPYISPYLDHCDGLRRSCRAIMENSIRRSDTNELSLNMIDSNDPD